MKESFQKKIPLSPQTFLPFLSPSPRLPPPASFLYLRFRNTRSSTGPPPAHLPSILPFCFSSFFIPPFLFSARRAYSGRRKWSRKIQGSQACCPYGPGSGAHIKKTLCLLKISKGAPAQKSPYYQLLVVRNCKFPYNSRAGLLAHRSSHRPPSRFPSGRTWPPLPKYSDEFVQDSHLFPFSPDPDHIRSDTRCFIQFLTSIAFYPV